RARAEVLAGVVPRRRPRGADRRAVPGAGLTGPRAGVRDLQEPHARGMGVVRARTRLLPGAGARARRGVGLRARARAPDGRRARPARRGAACAPARHPGQARPHPRRARPSPRPGPRRAHRAGARRSRLLGGGDRRAAGRWRRGGPGRDRARHDAEGVIAVAASSRAVDVSPPAPAGERELLKMSELAERSGVSPGTIRYYLREGLLGDGADIVRTSRNMAYYPPDYVERIGLIKRLQEERFMPLRVIRGALRRPRPGA